MTLARGRITTWAGAGLVVVIGWILGASLLPDGMPMGIVLKGLVLGGLSSLTAMGLVIVYRSARIINFAQAEIGGLAASVTIIMVTGWGIPYLLAVPVGMLFAFGTGALVDVTVVRTLFKAPRLNLTVATIGLAQVLGGLGLVLPHIITNVKPMTTFTTPFSWTFKIDPIVFNGDSIVAIVVVVLILVGLAYFFTRSGYGIAIRGAADSNDRALLLGIPVRRLSTVTWVLAAGLSGVGSILSAPILGPQLGVLAGPETLLPALTAAVLARLESLTVAFLAALVIGVFQTAVYWSYGKSTTVDVALFVVVLVALLFQRRKITRTDDSGLGSYVAQFETRPIPTIMRRLPEVRGAKAAGAVAVALIVFVLPLALNNAHQDLMAYMAIFAILAVSLVILTGWSGQISLGQFAFAGIGAGTTASLFMNAGTDLFVALIMAAVAGAVAAVIIGIPALRLSGPFLAVTTLAFAVPVSTWLLNSGYFPGFAVENIVRPNVLQRFDLNSPATFYYFCLLFLVICLLLARNFRRTRPGRATIAVRDNSRGAQSYGVSPLRSRLVAFAISGAMAGVAGGLYAIGLNGIPFSGYNPETSVQIFTMVVVGGMGSIFGGVLGAVYVQSVLYFLPDYLQLLATGGGILTIVQLFPGGLSEALIRLRDFGLRRIARRRQMSVPSLAEKKAFGDEGTPAPAGGIDVTSEIQVASPDSGMLVLTGVNASYGQVQVLFGVDLGVQQGEIVGLLGTNGSGKSTTLKVASGLLGAGKGKVWFEGRDLTKADPVERVKQGLVMVPSGRSIFPSLTVAENLRLAGWLSRNDQAFLDQTMEKVISLFPSLQRRFDTTAGSLSGGEQQMLTISQALFCKPKLLMIDELSLGLAPSVVADLLGVVRRLAEEGITVIVVEQSLNLATSIAKRAVFMERGQVRFTGPTAELAERHDLVRSVFLGSGTAEDTSADVSLFGEGGGISTMALLAGEAGPPPQILVRRDLPPAFSAIELGRTFGAVRALNDVSFDVAPGEILGIIGANGAGKTTLFDVCSGYLPGDGRIRLAGMDVTDRPAHERAEMGLGRIFQDARLFPSLTVSEVLAVALDRRLEVRDPMLSMLRTGSVIDSEQDAQDAIEQLISDLNLSRYRDAFISELSTGTRRVVELACVMAHQPSVLLLDEPTSGLAQREGEALGDLLLGLRERTGVSLVMIEHDVPLVSRISDRLLCLDLGQVIAEGRPSEVLENPLVIEAYLGTDSTAVNRSGVTAPSPATAETWIFQAGPPIEVGGVEAQADPTVEVEPVEAPARTTRTRTLKANPKQSANGAVKRAPAKKAAKPARKTATPAGKTTAKKAATAAKKTTATKATKSTKSTTKTTTRS